MAEKRQNLVYKPLLFPNAPAASLYTDAGLIGPDNPSKLGCTLAWRKVSAFGTVIAERALVCPAEICGGSVENNAAETLALALGLSTLPDGWCGTVYCDNLNAIRRLFGSAPWNTCPPWLVTFAKSQAARMGYVETIRLAGHPRRIDLERGTNDDLIPVSVHNFWCDKAAKYAGQAWLYREPCDVFDFEKET